MCARRSADSCPDPADACSSDVPSLRLYIKCLYSILMLG